MSNSEKQTKSYEGIYYCPICGLKLANWFWRQKNPERTKCQNGHKKTQMILYPSMIDLLEATTKARLQKSETPKGAKEW